MVIYRVSFFTKSGESKGFEYYAGDVIARAAARWAEERGEKAEVNSFEVPLTRDGLLRALHQFGMHADESLHAESKSKPPPEKRRLKFSLYNLRDIRGPVCHNHLRAYGYDLCMKTTNHILICIVSAYTSACFAQVVSNGDFEIPQVPSGIGVYSPTNATWVWPSGGTNGGIISPPGFIPSESASFQAPAAPTGNQIAFVQMAFSNYATMSESITLPADGIYRLSYYDAGRPTWAPGVGGNTTYNVLLDTNIIATVSTTTGQPFTPEAFTFSS